LQDEIFTRLCLLNLFIKIFFNQLNNNRNRDKLNWLNKIKGEKILFKVAHIKNIIWKENSFIFKNKFHLYKRLKKTIIDK
jgi:hypothetical protein